MNNHRKTSNAFDDFFDDLLGPSSSSEKNVAIIDVDSIGSAKKTEEKEQSLGKDSLIQECERKEETKRESGSRGSLFEQKLAAFRDFVLKHKRFPDSNGPTAEANLRRWFRSVRTGNISTTMAEKNAFQRMREELKKYPK